MASEAHKDGKPVKMKGMEKMAFAKYNGINYPQAVDDDQVEEKVKKLKETARDFSIRDDDTLLVGYPRCGNHWAHEVVNMILQQTTNYAPTSFVSNLLEIFLPDGEKILTDLKSPRLLCQHSFLSDLPTEAIQKRCKVIYLVREPRAALVSMYKLYLDLKGDAIRFGGTWEDFFETIMAGEFTWGNIIDHYKDMEVFRKKHPEIPIYIYSFEKAFTDPAQEIRNMCAFLGKPDHLALDIAKATSYDTMKAETKAKRQQEEEAIFDADKKGFLTGSKANAWKNWFTVTQNERICKYFKEQLDGTEVASLAECIC